MLGAGTRGSSRPAILTRMRRLAIRVLFLPAMLAFAACDAPPDARERNIELATGFFDDLLAGDQAKAKVVLAEDFEFTFMGHSEISRSYDRDTFFEEWLPLVFTLLPEGITLEVQEAIADDRAVVLLARGDSVGVNGEYDNDYAMVFGIGDGRIISLREYCSDLLVETRLFRRELAEIDRR